MDFFVAVDLSVDLRICVRAEVFPKRKQFGNPEPSSMGLGLSRHFAKKKALTARDKSASPSMSLSTDGVFFFRGMLRLPRPLFRRKGHQA